MIELAKAKNPVLNVLRQYAGIKRETPEKKAQPDLAHGVTQPDLGSNFQSPSDSPGQKALKAYWRI